MAEVDEEAVLQELGLTGNEAKAYMALTYLGPSIASDVAQRAGIHRALAYNTLARLVQKGFASEVVQDKTRMFSAISPEELRLKLEEKESALRKDVEGLVGALKKTYRKTKGPSAKVFTGADGIKSILSEELENTPENGTIYAYRALPELARLTPIFVAWWHKKRVAKGVRMQFLMDRSPASLERAAELKEMELTDVRLLKGEDHVPVTYHIFGEKVSIISASPEEMLGIIMESPGIGTLFQQEFLAAWQKASSEYGKGNK